MKRLVISVGGLLAVMYLSAMPPTTQRTPASQHSLAKTPIMLVVGKREAEERTVALRRLGGKEQEILALSDAIARLTTESAVPHG